MSVVALEQKVQILLKHSPTEITIQDISARIAPDYAMENVEIDLLSRFKRVDCGKCKIRNLQGKY